MRIPTSLVTLKLGVEDQYKGTTLFGNDAAFEVEFDEEDAFQWDQ